VVASVDGLTFVSRRSPILARKGMVATSQPLAAMAGLRVLMDGGNAADAAVTTAAMLNVVEPMSTGVGGDCFALVFDASTGKVSALNGSGRSPAGFTWEEAQKLGLVEMPFTGPLPVTVPGTVSGWEALLQRFGTVTLGECLAPAIRTAEEGFPVSPRISAAWRDAEEKIVRDPEAVRVYLPAPRVGELHRASDLAQTLRTIAEGGSEAFYRGPLAGKLAHYVQSQGGYLTTDDLASHTAVWSEPISSTYRGVEVLEHPPNGQGLAALVALNVLEAYDLGSMDFFDPHRWHLQIEAVRLGMVDAGRYVADPEFEDIPMGMLLSEEYAARRRSVIDPKRAMPLAAPGQTEHRDTVYLSVVDGQGHAVSFISSLYHAFGCGLVVPGTGICLQNRGACFTLEEGHPNAVGGGKRPYHTIIPAMAMRGGALWLSFGVMGGFMQPQGHVQVLSNMIDHGMDAQTALDAPRFRVDERGGPEVLVEAGVPDQTLEALMQMGHHIHAEPLFGPGFGGGQVIAVDPDSGALEGGSDPRKDGCAVGF
jgi:gamma-glutamyltranspeptidase/glutathione hydrolase